MDRNTRLIDLVPRRPRTYVALAVAGVVCVGVLEALFVIMPWLASRATDGRVASLDLDGEGSLAVWFSTTTLTAGALASCLVYAADAERGKGRRLWLWGALCWLTMSIDECSSVHEAFKEFMSHLTGERLIHDGTIWWVMGYFAVLSVTGLLILSRMRAAPTAAAVWLGTALFYAVAVASEMAWILPKDNRGVMLEEGCEMLGNLCLLVSHLLFARHLIISAEQAGESTQRRTIASAVPRAA